MTTALRLTIKRSVAVLVLALGVLGVAVVRGNEALLVLLFAGPLVSLAGSLVFEPTTTTDDRRESTLGADASRTRSDQTEE